LGHGTEVSGPGLSIAQDNHRAAFLAMVAEDQRDGVQGVARRNIDRFRADALVLPDCAVPAPDVVLQPGAAFVAPKHVPAEHSGVDAFAGCVKMMVHFNPSSSKRSAAALVSMKSRAP